MHGRAPGRLPGRVRRRRPPRAGALRAVQAAGRRVPEDVAVIGFDDVPLASRTTPALSTVHQPCQEMGRTAARMLVRFLDGEAVPEPDVVLPTTLVVRESTQEAAPT